MGRDCTPTPRQNRLRASGTAVAGRTEG
jgi:hypothetical protein